MPGSSSVPRIKRLFSGNPIVTKQESHPWESRVTFNPACAFVEDRDELSLLIPSLPFGAAIRKRLQEQPGLCFLLYRAQGEKTPSYDHTRSSVGLAVLSPELELLARHEEPVLLPDHAYDNLGVEDGRITKVGKRYVMIYTAYGTGERDNRIRIAAASTTDFVHWEKLGLLQGDFNEINNKNAMLFPGSVDGTMVMLHRPMEGENAMAIHWAEAHELMGPWRSRGMLMAPRPNPAFKDTWIGGGAPPIPLDDGRYLILYHMGNRKTDGTREYDLGIAVCDPRQAPYIVRRDEPLLRPETALETHGDPTLGVNNVVFICGAYMYRGDLYFPYAGADSVVLGGRISGDEIRRYCAG